MSQHLMNTSAQFKVLGGIILFAGCQVMSLNELLKSLEDSGEVNLQVAEHKIEKDAAGNFSVAALEGVCFVLDPLKKKKKAKVGPPFLSFSHYLSLSLFDLSVLP